MTSQRLPQTDSIRELAKFWDTHDLTELEDELEEVREPIFEREAEITLRLEANEAQAIGEMAKSRGVRDSDLIRQWIHEKLDTSS